MPRFNPRTGSFMAAVQSNYKSYFKPECRNDAVEMAGDKQPISYDQDYNESPERMDDSYYKPRRRTRPHYTSNINIVIRSQKIIDRECT